MQADEFLRAAREFFRNQQYAVVIESETAWILEEHLVAEGWTLDEEEIAMILTAASPEIPSPPDGLAVLQVTSDESYEDYMTVVPGNREWVPTLDAATDPGVALFVGYVEGQPVATARLVCYGSVAEITGVQTLESHRRRGFGRALTLAAMSEARRRGCAAITLTATEMGYPLYLSMGFEEVCSYRTYEPPPTG
ncbi:MAG: GNAT family N-acetyltransferase [Thermomicrobiales bacterium]